MTLERTVIIPAENQELAQRLFKTIIYDEDVLVVVVLGNDPISEQAVKCADKRAKVVVQGFERKVAWIQDRDTLANKIRQLKPGQADISKEDLAGVVAFSVSLGNTVMDIVRVNEEINFLRMDIAFLEAGKA